MSITWDGLDDITSMLEDLELDVSKEERILKKVGNVLKTEIKSSIAESTGYNKRQVKSRLVKNGDGRYVKVYVDSYDFKFNEYGTSKDRSNVGKFANAVDRKEDEVVSMVEEELLKGV